MLHNVLVHNMSAGHAAQCFGVLVHNMLLDMLHCVLVHNMFAGHAA